MENCIAINGVIRAVGGAVMISLLAGCAALTGSDDVILARAMSNTSNLSGETIIPLKVGDQGPEMWLATSEQQGTLLLDRQGVHLDDLPGETEHLDVRHGVKLAGASVSLAATVDTAANRPMIVSVNGQQARLKREALLPAPDFEIEDICLFRDRQQLIHLFLVDGAGRGEQWLVLDSASQTVVTRKIREFSLPPGSSSCTVDDANSRLLVLEEERGIWIYPADPESGATRKPLSLSNTMVTGLAAIPNGLLAIDPEQKTVYRFLLDADANVVESSRRSLSGIATPEELSVYQPASDQQTASVFYLGLYDDETDQYFHASLSWPEAIFEKTPEAAPVMATIEPVVQTRPVGVHGDVADDPAIWVNRADPANSRVIGTNKKQGLHIYDLSGNELQFFASGRLNNVDVRYGFSTAVGLIDLAAASNRSSNSIALFSIHPDSGEVSEAGLVPTDLSEIYGLCMYQPELGAMHVFVNDKDGRYQQYELYLQGQKINGRKVRSFSVASQPEGCVAFDRQRVLFVGEESEGVWTIGADASAGTVLSPVVKTGSLLQDDVEGIAVYEQPGNAYLIVSSQGNDSYLVLDANAPYQVRGSFRVGINARAGIDGASETDGLDVTSAGLGMHFSRGMLVVQDGRNRMPEATQNFKYIPWQSIQTVLNLE